MTQAWEESRGARMHWAPVLVLVLLAPVELDAQRLQLPTVLRDPVVLGFVELLGVLLLLLPMVLLDSHVMDSEVPLDVPVLLLPMVLLSPVVRKSEMPLGVLMLLMVLPRPVVLDSAGPLDILMLRWMQLPMVLSGWIVGPEVLLVVLVLMLLSMVPVWMAPALETELPLDVLVQPPSMVLRGPTVLDSVKRLDVLMLLPMGRLGPTVDSAALMGMLVLRLMLAPVAQETGGVLGVRSLLPMGWLGPVVLAPVGLLGGLALMSMAVLVPVGLETGVRLVALKLLLIELLRTILPIPIVLETKGFLDVLDLLPMVLLDPDLLDAAVLLK